MLFNILGHTQPISQINLCVNMWKRIALQYAREVALKNEDEKPHMYLVWVKFSDLHLYISDTKSQILHVLMFYPTKIDVIHNIKYQSYNFFIK